MIMNRNLGMDSAGWFPGNWASLARPILPSVTRQFDLLRWFSVFSFIAVFVFSVAFATILSHFLKQEILQRDAILTSQFVHSVAEAQMRQAQLNPALTLGQILDERVDLARLGIDPSLVTAPRAQFYEHLRVLPDALLATVFAPDRKVLWSTNPELVGKIDTGNDELEEALGAEILVSTEYDAEERRQKLEQRFVHQPQKFFVENYMPLIDPLGKVVAVVEIYKEPSGLEQTIRRGVMLVWSCTALGAIFLYFALFWIIRRAHTLLQGQRRRLVETEALCVIGEMSAAVAHGIRNPLASIRSSAELALDGDLDSTRKNAADIISQVDRLGKWVRDLLVFSRPVAGDNQSVDLVALVDDCLPGFATQLQSGRVSCEFVRPSEAVPAVVGNRALANQALANIIANAIEAMPEGGSLRIELQPDLRQRRVRLVVTDSGSGMSASEMELAFKPFYTTKRKGLGLGMAQVKRIMERFGGAISLHSQKGTGTQVSLSFNMV
jgi:two-component system sensor histidine kinase HydH